MPEKTKRQLAAIMFADIAGYTAMMQVDEAKALACLTKFKKELEINVPKSQGKIIQFYGDGCLVVFNNAVDSVHSAIDLQTSFQTEPKVPVRIGIHLGDVVFKEDNIFGDHVNIASRIESIGIPGAILFSINIRNQIKNRPEFQLTSLGDFEFKNVKESIEVYALSNDGFIVPNKSEIDGKLKIVTKNNEVEKSIAVLAFENRSGDPEQEYFSDGISEEIIYALSKLDNIKVAGRASSFSFKGKNEDFQVIGNKLNVRNLLEGSVRKMGNRVRITAQLVNVENGFQIWTERFDRELEDIFAIQDDIAQNIASKLELTLLSDSKKQPLVKPHTQNINAYEYYLKGRHFIEQRKHLDIAVSHFRKALEIDPKFALAHSGLAYSYFYQVYFNNQSPSIYLLKAREEAQKAISINPDIPEPYIVEGIVTFYYDRDSRGALAHYEKAIELNPKASDVYRVKAYYYSMIGEFDNALKLIKKAISMDPLNINIQLSYGEILYRCAQFDKAIEVLTIFTEKFPDSKIAWIILANAHYFNGNVKAFQDIISGIDINYRPISFYLFSAYSILIELRQSQKAVEFLAAIEKEDLTKWISSASIALVHLGLGNEVKAEYFLKKALEERDPVIMVINAEPTWKKFKSYPLIQSTLKSIGLIE